MSAEEFAGLCDFAMGSVRGVRSFDIDKLGRLTGVTYKSAWRPGENTAECLKRDDAWSSLAGLVNSSFNFNYSAGGVIHPARITAEPPKKKSKRADAIEDEAPKPPHTMATCACGFYAYYDGSDDYRQGDRITAVVEGYGETLIGTRGFRASKARILALRIRKSVPALLVEKVRRNYPDVPVFDSFKRMVAEFPPDTTAAPSPETDPNFWERSA